jgi:hypothetical protein
VKRAVVLVTMLATAGSARADEFDFFVGPGVTEGVADGVGVVPGGRVSVELPSRLTFAVVGSSKVHQGVREAASALMVGYRFNVQQGRLTAWAGLDAGGGVVIHSPRVGLAGMATYSPQAVLAPVFGGAVRISRDYALGVEITAATTAIERDGSLTGLVLPAAWLELITHGS